MRNLQTLWKRRRAMTLVELLVVIVIIAIVATMVYLRYGDAVGQARETRLTSDTRQIQDAVTLFWSHTGEYPVDSNGNGDGTDPRRVYDLVAEYGDGTAADKNLWVPINIAKIVFPYTGSDNVVRESYLPGVPMTSYFDASPASKFDGAAVTGANGYQRNPNHDALPVVYLINVGTGKVAYLPVTNPIAFENVVNNLTASVETGSDAADLGDAGEYLPTEAIVSPLTGETFDADQHILFPVKANTTDVSGT